MTRWLIGACARALDPTLDRVQTFMLVLDGPQGIGKSFLAHALSKPFGNRYFVEGPLLTNDKDTYVRLLGTFVWEVSELGATIHKQDIEALKAIVSQRRVTVRRAYGRYDMEGPVLCSLLGTVNNSAGLLADPTGNRRFAIVQVKKINWSYSKDVDMEQVWAQAMKLYWAGESWNFSLVEREQRDNVNKEYEFEDPILAPLLQCFDISENYKDNFVPTYRIAERLKTKGVNMGTDRSLYMAIANTMTRLGKGKPQRKIYLGKKSRGYSGVFERAEIR